MSATGIGAAVRRKEDQRFITGKGHYTDDINRPGQSYAYFVRSPHAHATIKSIDTKAAAAMPGVVGGAHRRRPRRRQDRQPDLRLDDPFQGRLADEDGAASGASPTTRPAIVGDPVAVVIAETLDAGARCRAKSSRSITRYCRRSPIPPRRRARTRRRSTTIAPHNTIYQWHLGDAKAVDAGVQVRHARHQARHRQ